jgi:type I restriction enzyme, R subunit
VERRSIMTVAINEDTYAERPALEWLEEVGWAVVEGKEIAPNSPGAERANYQDVILADRLRGAVKELNPELPTIVIEQVVTAVRSTESPLPILDHQEFHRLLITGVPVTYRGEDGDERSVRAKLINWDDPTRNDYVAVRQVVIIGPTQKNDRTDILLFVNGIPLAEIELKDPKKANAEEAVGQVERYVREIPQLYRFVEFVLVSDLFEARVGTITTPAEHFAEWRSMDPDEEAGRSRLEVAIRGLFPHERFLDLVRNFMLFETDGISTAKVMAKYHQLDAVNRAIESAARAKDTDGRGGVVWHSQGSGKSYSMVFFAAKLRRDVRFETPTIVAVCDRLDLDDQLYQQFAGQKQLAEVLQHADSIEELHDYLDTPADDIVFTTIQKFQPLAEQSRMPVISERSNVIVIADEAHRTQYGSYAQNITLALPNAVRIGFTGTPIEKSDRSTRLVFGDYISVYKMARSIEDGATVPIYYESRRIPLQVEDPDLVDEIADLLEAEDDEVQLSTVSSWARLEKLVGADDRVRVLAEDIAKHFTARLDEMPGKGLVVAMSRDICARLADLLKEQLGEDVVTCVITASSSDKPYIAKWERSRQERRQVERDFKDPYHPLRLVVVRDMWLTGFDVPSLHTLYVDKPMKDHGLLQAITRVNRVFRDKPGGLVVDFIGIGEDLRKSLTAYSEDVIEDAVFDLKTAISKLQEKHDIVGEIFHGIDYRGRHTMSPGQRATVFVQAYDRVVTDEETRERFIKECSLLIRWYKLVNPHQAAIEVQDDLAFYAPLLERLRGPHGFAPKMSKEAEQALKQFYSEGLAAGEVVDVYKLIGEDRPEVSILSDAFLDQLEGSGTYQHVKVDVLKRLLQDEIRVREKWNNMQARLFDAALREVLNRYELKQLTSAEVIHELVELAKRMREARRRHEALGLSVEEAAFYDAVAGTSEDWDPDPVIAAIARDLVKSIRADLQVDWADRESVEAAIRVKVKRLLRRHNYKPKSKGGGKPLDRDHVTDLVMEQARTLYRLWPEVFGADLPV